MTSFNFTAEGLQGNDRGGALVEFAIVLLPLIMIFALIIEGGHLIWQHQVAIKAVRNTTRYLSRVPHLVGPGCVVDHDIFSETNMIVRRLGATGRLDGLGGLLPGMAPDLIHVLPPAVISLEPCVATVAVESSVQVTLPFAPVLRLFDPAVPDALTFRVGDHARYIGE